MGSILSRFLKKRELKKAFERGAELRKRGKTLIPTTGGFVEVPIGSEISKRYIRERAGGGGGRSSSSSRRIAEENARRQAEQKAEIERKRQAELKAKQEKEARERAQAKLAEQRNRNIRSERNRIKALEDRLRREGANRRIQTFTDSKTGDKIQHETLINRKNERIFIVTNLTSGKKTTRTFEGARGRVRQTGGLSTGATPTQKDFKKELDTAIATEQAKLTIDPTKRKLTIIERINLIGATTGERKERYLDDLKLKDLEKERNNIFDEINKVNSKYKGELTESQYTQYIKDISPLLARYNQYSKIKTDVVKKFPELETKATLEFDPNIGKNVLVLDAKDLSLTNKVNQSIRNLTTAIQRGKGGIGVTALLSGAVIAQTAIATATGIRDLPSTINAIRKNPALLKQIPSAIAQSGRDFGALLRLSPTAAFVKLGSFYYSIKVTDAGFRQLGKLSSAGFVRLNPKFVGVLRAGQNVVIKTGKGVKVNLQVVDRIPLQAISKQVALAGQKVKVAVSTQADNLIGLIRSRSRTLGKPLGKALSGKRIEDVLGKTASKLLRKHDAGLQLTTKEINFLDNTIKKAGAKGILERALFADPTGKIRPSRLGIKKPSKLKLMDYLVGDITFRRVRPQILLFEDVVIEKFPKAIKDIAKKLSKGGTITSDEAAQLLRFQLKQSGKFKPVGFVSRESEITLATNEVIKRVKKVGVTRVNGVNIPIIKVKIIKLGKALKNTLDKFRAGKLTQAEIIKLDIALAKTTGFKYGLSSSGRVGVRYVSLKRLGLSTSVRAISRRAISRRPRTYKGRSVKYTKSGKPYIQTKSGRKSVPKKSISPKAPSKPSPKKPSPRSPKSPKRPVSPKRPITPIKKPVIILRFKKSKTRRLKKPTNAYFVAIKKRGRFVRTKIPLLINDARDLLSFKVDRGLSRTAKIIPAGKKRIVGIINPEIKGYFAKNKKKFRKFKIIKGKKIPMVRKYIEKKRFVGDTKMEIKQLQLARRKAKLKITRRKPVGKRNMEKKVIKRGATLKKKTIRRSIKSKTKKKIQKPRKQKRRIPRKPLKSQRTKKTKMSRKATTKKKK